MAFWMFIVLMDVGTLLAVTVYVMDKLEEALKWPN